MKSVVVCLLMVLLFGMCGSTAFAVEAEESALQAEDSLDIPEQTAAADTPARREVTAATERRFGITDRLVIGLRYTYIWLRDSDRSHKTKPDKYLGSIDKLNTRQSDYPAPFVMYKLTDMFSVLISYDWVSARTVKTITKNNSYTDGIIFLEGPVIAGRAEYPNHTRYTPFVELGAAFYSSSFDHDYEWAHVGAHRRMKLDDPIGLMALGGLDIAVKDSWCAHMYVRYLDVETKGKFIRNGAFYSDGKFPLSNYGAGAGVSYIF